MAANYMQWIILFLVIGASLISWIIKKVQEEQERRAVREAATKRELERLRTGRDPGDGSEVESASQMQRAQELQARRQQQLQELRRRQQERARQPQSPMHIEQARVGPAAQPTARTQPSGTIATGSTRGPVVWAPGSSGTTVPSRPQAPVRRTPAQQPSRARPQPTPRPQTAGSSTVNRTVTPRSTRSLFPQAAPAPVRPQAPAAPPPPRRLAPAREAYAQGAEVGPSLLSSIKPVNSDEWRRAIIMHEILSPPVGERDRPY